MTSNDLNKSEEKMNRKIKLLKVGKNRFFLETKHYAQGVKTAIPVLTVKGKKPVRIIHNHDKI